MTNNKNKTKMTKTNINPARPTTAELLATASRMAVAGLKIDPQVFQLANNVATIKKQFKV